MSILQSLTNCKVLSTVSQIDDYEGWKAARSRGIGGSEIGAICGVSPYATPRTIYLRKTAQYDDDFSDEAKERMDWGHRLEPLVSDRYTEESGNKVVVSPATLVHKDHPWAIANVDRFIVDEAGNPIGILEAKTTDSRNYHLWSEGEPPISYIYQLQWYMWITGLQYGALACLVGGNKFFFFEMFINDYLVHEVMVPAADKLWNHNIKNLIEPEISGIEADSELLKKLFPAENATKGTEMQLEGELYNQLAAQHIALKAQAKALEKEIDAIANKLTEQLGDTEIGYTTEHTIKWTPQTQTRVDTDKFKLNFPQIYSQVTKQISFKKLSVK